MKILDDEIEKKIQNDIIDSVLQKEYDLARRLTDLVYDLVKELVDSGDKNSYWIAYRACGNLAIKRTFVNYERRIAKIKRSWQGYRRYYTGNT